MVNPRSHSLKKCDGPHGKAEGIRDGERWLAKVEEQAGLETVGRKTYGRRRSGFFSPSGNASFLRWLFLCSVSPTDCTREARRPTVIPTATETFGGPSAVVDRSGACSRGHIVPGVV